MRYIIIAILSVVSALAQSSLTLSVVNNGPIRAGAAVQVQAVLNGSLAAWQASLTSSVGGSWSATPGPATVAAGHSLSCNAPPLPFMCLASGTNASSVGDGVVAIFTIDVPSTVSPGVVTITPGNLVGSTLAGDVMTVTSNPLTFTVSPPISPCDVNGDGTVDTADILAVIKQVLGMSPASVDLDGDSKTTVVDLRRVSIAAFGGSCRLGR